MQYDPIPAAIALEEARRTGAESSLPEAIRPTTIDEGVAAQKPGDQLAAAHLEREDADRALGVERQIQRDIADYMAQLKANEKANDISQRNKELAEWISIYNELLNLPYDRKTFKPEK